MAKKNFHWILLASFILFGLLFRLRWWPDYVTFGYEQARDALAAQNIFLDKKLTLIGPTSEIEGIFHGPVYYYLIGLPYFLFGKNPSSASLLHLLLNVVSIPIIFLAGRSLFNIRVGLLAAFLFTFSYEVASYSLWLSNPSPSLPFIILAYLLLHKALTKNQLYLPIASFLFALGAQFDLIIIMNVIPAFIIYLLYHQKALKTKTLILSLGAFFIPLVNYPLFELRHNFLMTRKMLEVFASQDTQLKTILDYLFFYLQGLSKEFANVLFPTHGFFAGLLMLILILYLWRKVRSMPLQKGPWAFLLIWVFSTFPIFLIQAQVTTSEFSFFGVNAAISLLTANFISELWSKKKKAFAFLLVLVILLANLRAWNHYFPNPMRKLFDAQRGVILKDLKDAVNYTYATGTPFYVETLTVPLYISPLWDYLYSWYGQEKFGYLPSKNQNTSPYFFIIEPGWGYTYEIFKQKAIGNINQKTKVEETKNFGMITVEKRRLLETQSKPQEKTSTGQ